MERFIRLSDDERRRYFVQTAERMRLSPQIIEKDFWVYWTLRELFALPIQETHWELQKRAARLVDIALVSKLVLWLVHCGVRARRGRPMEEAAGIVERGG